MACAFFICGSRLGRLTGWPVGRLAGSCFVFVAVLFIRTYLPAHAYTASVVTAPLAGEAVTALVLPDFSFSFVRYIYLPVQSRDFDKCHFFLSFCPNEAGLIRAVLNKSLQSVGKILFRHLGLEQIIGPDLICDHDGNKNQYDNQHDFQCQRA